jgi:four helix bundle protein
MQNVKRGPWSVDRKEKEMALQSFRDLEVWKVAMDLAAECYRVTKPFPKDELFGITSQIRRAAVSIPANIAEGQGRDHTKEFLNHLSIARGSLMELQTHLLLCQWVGLIQESDLQQVMPLCERVSMMLSRLRQALEKKVNRGP